LTSWRVCGCEGELLVFSPELSDPDARSFVGCPEWCTIGEAAVSPISFLQS
jgi:hypothetical protein